MLKRVANKYKAHSIIGASALLAVGAGVASQEVVQTPEQVQQHQTSQAVQPNHRDMKGKQHVTLTSLLQEFKKNGEVSLKSGSDHTIRMVETVPRIYGRPIETSYDLRDILGIEGTDVYYQAERFSESNPMLMKMTSYRDMMQANPNIQVSEQETLRPVSPHLYDDEQKAIADSANWKNSKVVKSDRAKTMTFSHKDKKPLSLNFTADDGTMINHLKLDNHIQLTVKAADNQVQLSEDMKSDFEDAMEKNYTITYGGLTYHAIYHDKSVKTHYGSHQVDGYFTFSSSTHGTPLKIKNQYIVATVNFGAQAASLSSAVSLHAVRSLDNPLTWLNTDDPNVAISVKANDKLSDDHVTYYQIMGQEQVIQSYKYDYVTVNAVENKEKVASSQVAYADEVTPQSNPNQIVESEESPWPIIPGGQNDPRDQAPSDVQPQVASQDYEETMPQTGGEDRVMASGLHDSAPDKTLQTGMKFAGGLVAGLVGAFAFSRYQKNKQVL